MMTSREIRRSFLDFFRSKGHDIVPSSPVVLPSDPTLLFANAGMNQFKDIFLGARAPAARRVANTQKCIRVSGKHNDLEEVGRDTYHHTFFEMLGNWSFGDYYKREAIQWAWELLTSVWRLPRARLWATVYREDNEAAALWREVTDIDRAHILRFEEKHNFWEMGDAGPCGPCSEIHFDRAPTPSPAAFVNAGRPEVIEIWNLVFIQFNRRADGSLEELPLKHVDTGMGFERVTAVLQDRASNYDTDIFEPLIGWLRDMSGQPYEGDAAVAMRVIADHIRTLAFAIADGVLPSNEGRGYVLRRLLRRAVRYGRKLGFHEPFLGHLAPVLVETMGDVFPELPAHADAVVRALAAEEEGFAATLDRGLGLFDDAAAAALAAGRATFPGAEAFRLYDTYGFPIDLTRLMAAERGLALDEADFERHMQAQRDRARSARRDAQSVVDADRVTALATEGLRAEFVGYEHSEAAATVQAIYSGSARVATLAEGAEGELLLDVTPFYGESGGQVGDRGLLEGPEGTFEVTDTRKPADGIIIHVGRVVRGRVSGGDRVQATIDEARRAAVVRHHTGTHLLNAALRAFVGSQVKQAGSLVAPDRLRLDFTWFEAVPRDTLHRIEEQINQWIIEDRPVHARHIPLSEVYGSDIVAIFDEKYGDIVRVVEVEGVSKELCGGTHARRTGELGLFRLVSEASVAAGVRRIEAMCGLPAWRAAHTDRTLVEDLSRRLSAAPADLPGRIDSLIKEQRRLKRTARELEAAAAAGRAEALLASRIEVDGIPLVTGFLGETSPESLQEAVDHALARLPGGVVVLAGVYENKAAFAVAASDEAVRRGAHAGRLAGAVARLAGGGGGGRPNRAQAGGRDAACAESAIVEAAAILRSQIGRD